MHKYNVEYTYYLMDGTKVEETLQVTANNIDHAEEVALNELSDILPKEIDTMEITLIEEAIDPVEKAGAL